MKFTSSESRISGINEKSVARDMEGHNMRAARKIWDEAPQAASGFMDRMKKGFAAAAVIAAVAFPASNLNPMAEQERDPVGYRMETILEQAREHNRVLQELLEQLPEAPKQALKKSEQRERDEELAWMTGDYDLTRASDVEAARAMAGIFEEEAKKGLGLAIQARPEENQAQSQSINLTMRM